MSDRDTTSNMGSSTETHITGSDETGTFITDEPPTTTPTASTGGSSNLGINTTGANLDSFDPHSSGPAEAREGAHVSDVTATREAAYSSDVTATRESAYSSDVAGDADGSVDLSRVSVGMTVVDSEGEEAGRVSAVQLPGTHARPDAPAGIAESMEGTGYLEVDGSGHLANDTYVAGYQIAGTSEVVTLRVRREELIRVS